MKIDQSRKVRFLLVSLYLVSFLLPQVSFAQTTFVEVREQTKGNSIQIENIKDKILDLKDNYHLLYDGAKNQNDQLSNMLSYSGILLAIMGLIFASYINTQYEKIKEMKETVEDTKKYIEGHGEQLYLKIKRDETRGLLERLEMVPEDVLNVSILLLARELLDEDYIKLRNSFLKVAKNPSQRLAKGAYIILFMQHFPYQSLKDADVKSEIISNINISSLNNMFDRDIRNFFEQTFRYLKEFGIGGEESKTIVKNLLYNYSKSSFQTNVELRDYIKKTALEHSLNISELSVIAKEQAPADTIYLAWINTLLV